MSRPQADRRRRRLLQLGGVLGVAAAIVVVLVLVSQGGKEAPNASTGAAVTGVSDARAMLAGIPQQGTRLGDPKAPVVLTEFADLQCPFCRDYALNVLPQIIERYVRTGKLRLELRLRSFLGEDSVTAARAPQRPATRNRLWHFAELFYPQSGHREHGLRHRCLPVAHRTRRRRAGALVTAEQTQTPALATAAGHGRERGPGRRADVDAVVSHRTEGRDGQGARFQAARRSTRSAPRSSRSCE